MHRMHFNLIALLAICILCSCDKQGSDVDIAPAKWEVISTKVAWHAFPDRPEKEYVLELTSEMSYKIVLDVNYCGGKFNKSDSGEIEFTHPACTEACCDSEYAERLMQILREVSRYDVLGGKLILRGDGEITLKRL